MTEARTRGARHRAAPARPAAARLGVAAGLVGAAVVVSLAATGGSYALWNGAAPASSGSTITSGSTQVLIDGGHGESLDGLDAAALTPGTGVARAFSVRNAGTTPVTLALHASTSRSGEADDAFSRGLTLQIAQVASASDCTPATTGGASGALDGYAVSYPHVPAGYSFLACAVVTLNGDADPAGEGGRVGITMAIDADQEAP